MVSVVKQFQQVQPTQAWVISMLLVLECIDWTCSEAPDADAESRVLRAVDKVLESAQPSVEFTRKKYTDAHDAVVASATYSKAMEAAEAIVSNFKHSFVYRTAAARLYPVVSQFTDPALDRIVQSQYYSAVVDHLRPTSPPNCLQTAQ